MVDFLRRRFLPSANDVILVQIDPSKKIPLPFDINQSVFDVIHAISSDISTSAFSTTESKHSAQKQTSLVIIVKEKKGETWKRAVHSFELIRNLRSFPGIDLIEYEVQLLRNPYLDETRRTIFLGSTANKADAYILKGPLEKRSKSDKFKKKQVCLFSNYIQYASTNKTKIISLDSIISVQPDSRSKHTFSLLMSNKVHPYFFKAESDINMKKWISSIQQVMSQFRDMKHIQQYNDNIVASNKATTKSLTQHTNRYLYRLEAIVKNQYLINRVYQTIQNQLGKLSKQDKDMLFQVLLINENPSANFVHFAAYFNQQSQASSDQSSFKVFLEKNNLLDIFLSLFTAQTPPTNPTESPSNQSQKSSVEETSNESLEIESSMNGNSIMKSVTRTGQRQRTFQSQKSNVFGSALNSTEQSITISLDIQVKGIPKVIDRLNFIFIEYMISQYRNQFRFSEMISRILCEYRITNSHYTPQINIFQHQILEPNDRSTVSGYSQKEQYFIGTSSTPMHQSSHQQEYNAYSWS